MNKTELKADLLGRSWVKTLIKEEDTLLAVPEGVNLKLYRQSFLEVGDVTAVDRAVFFYVVDEEEPTEEAWYKNNEPTPSISEVHWLARKYEDDILAVNGKVVFEGTDYIVVDGYKTDPADANNMIAARWFVKEVDGVKSIKPVTL
jgi:hypothetical protein